MREMFVTRLVADVLGPRGGCHEELPESPMAEYITGVLSPVIRHAEPDPDAQLELPTEEFVEETEETEGAEPLDVTPFAPVLNPQSRPFSLGLSFVLELSDPEARSTVDLCVTWARYEQLLDGHGTRWGRRPRAVVLRALALVAGTRWLGPAGPTTPEAAEVSVHLMLRRLGTGQTLVTVYLVNRIVFPADRAPAAEDHVYQPQLRVCCGQGARVVPGLDAAPAGDEERVLRFLYRDRPVLARGHLCSAVWRDIDPEVLPSGPVALDFPGEGAAPPFAWGDGALLPAADRVRFTGPDIRSEYVPMLAVPAPELTLPGGVGNAPELGAATLAEHWDAPALTAALGPVLDGYRRWIWTAWRTARVLEVEERAIGRALLDDCRTTARRMRLGLALLAHDDDVRLAFCFAMRAMALQATWPVDPAVPGAGAVAPARGPRAGLVWRPFQIAFILAALESIANPASPDRDVCDLLWVPTGGGKTEAYLALMAFTMALRRRRAIRSRNGRDADPTGAGVAVLSRYTLRLLSLQQFRRTLRLVTACEALRVAGLGSAGAARRPVGWRPTACTLADDHLWGSARFSAGLWVGQSVAPNKLQDSWANGRTIPGALSILGGASGAGEPAQVLRCPACDTVLALPTDGAEQVPAGGYVLRWTVRGPIPNPRLLLGIEHDGLVVERAHAAALPDGDHRTLSVRLGGRSDVTAELVDQLWTRIAAMLPGVIPVCAAASRPGYFLRRYVGNSRPYDFAILCPSLGCPLHTPWCEGSPAGCVHGAPAQAAAPAGGIAGIPRLTDGHRLTHVCEPFRDGSPFLADRVPIPAYTVDDQVYHRCPTVVIATVDKFARPAFEPRAAALFGNVTRHHCVHGYYREFLHPGGTVNTPQLHPSPGGRREGDTWVRVAPFAPPDLIVQDELHLIEGPLGSLVGLYETAVDELCRGPGGHPVKYVASSATVRQARDQVQSVFARRLATFPPPGLSADDSYFVRFTPRHPLEDASAGRLYAGVCAPGRGPLTPLLRLWARLLQTAHAHATHAGIDPFWTLTGYFNAIRELAGARALYRQDIPERLDLLARLDGAGVTPRPLPEDRAQELSGRMESTQLPVVLELLNAPGGQSALFTTSMFGTGVDVPRLGLMVVNGQPKTTSAYIQATGRVGRSGGALVVTFLRATRPRDLNHYEYFCGYHVQLHRHVEPITVMPFAPGARDRGVGPVGVFLLRNGRGPTGIWAPDGIPPRAMHRLRHVPEVTAIPPILESRAAGQPAARRPTAGAVQAQSDSALDDWHAVAGRHTTTLRYVEYTDPPSAPVVLGDAQHQHQGFEVVYENVPQSLRDIEETCGFQT